MKESFRVLIYGVIFEFTEVTEKKQRKHSVRMAGLLSDIESVNLLIRRTVAVRFLRYILELEFEVEFHFDFCYFYKYRHNTEATLHDSCCYVYLLLLS